MSTVHSDPKVALKQKLKKNFVNYFFLKSKVKNKFLAILKKAAKMYFS